MLKKIFGHGIENEKNLFNKKNSGFALIFALAILFAISFLPCTLCVLQKMKIQNIQKKSRQFYQSLEKQNEEVLKNWKNPGEKNETD